MDNEIQDIYEKKVKDLTLYELSIVEAITAVKKAIHNNSNTELYGEIIYANIEKIQKILGSNNFIYKKEETHFTVDGRFKNYVKIIVE